MRHTRFPDDPQDIVPNRATGYDFTPEGELEIDVSDFEQTAMAPSLHPSKQFVPTPV